MLLRKLEERNVEFEVVAEPEHMPIKGNVLASGDDEEDAEAERNVRWQLGAGNLWAWCSVRVTARIPGLPGVQGNAYLGGCSYESKEAFCAPDGYLPDMKAEALAELQEKLDRLVEKLEPLLLRTD